MLIQLLAGIAAAPAVGVPLVNLSPITITKAGGGFKICEFIIYRNGDLEVDSSVRTDEWVIATDKEPTLGDLYECKASKTSGSLTLSGIVDDTWTSLSSTSRAMSVGTSGTGNWIGDFAVREVANISNTQEVLVQLIIN